MGNYHFPSEAWKRPHRCHTCTTGWMAEKRKRTPRWTCFLRELQGEWTFLLDSVLLPYPRGMINDTIRRAYKVNRLKSYMHIWEMFENRTEHVHTQSSTNIEAGFSQPSQTKYSFLLLFDADKGKLFLNGQNDTLFLSSEKQKLAILISLILSITSL